MHRPPRKFVSSGGTIDVPVTSDILWEALTDYDNLETFQPNIEASRILFRRSDDAIEVEQILKARFFFFSRRVRAIRRMEEMPPVQIDCALIEVDFRVFETSWELKSIRDGQRLRLSTRLQPAFFVPGWILDRVIRRSAPKSLEAVKREAVRRMRKRAIFLE